MELMMVYNFLSVGIVANVKIEIKFTPESIIETPLSSGFSSTLMITPPLLNWTVGPGLSGLSLNEKNFIAKAHKVWTFPDYQLGDLNKRFPY